MRPRAGEEGAGKGNKGAKGAKDAKGENLGRRRKFKGKQGRFDDRSHPFK